MGYDCIEIGPTPSNEQCAQLGQDNYREQAKREMNAFIDQLKRHFPDIPEYVRFKIKWSEHDFGEYGEVVVMYKEDDEEALKFALMVESNTPANWDEQAKMEINSEQSYIPSLTIGAVLENKVGNIPPKKKIYNIHCLRCNREFGIDEEHPSISKLLTCPYCRCSVK